MVRLAEDADLIERAQRGDDDAYAMLVQRYQTIAFRTAWMVCGDPAEAEDAAQEAFLKAHAALPRFRAGAPWRPWLLRIVANEARNRRRSAGRRSALALRAAQEPSGEGAASADGCSSPAARSASAARRPADRRRLRASLATIVSSQGRNGSPARKRPSAR